MSGHSKWSTIKHKKAAQDAKRGKVFTKIIREIMVAAKEGGGDPDANPRLRLAVNKAKLNNMPNDNVDRAIKKGTGDLEGVNYMEITYEGYGPSGVAILVDALTDNKNRTAGEVRNIFNKNNGNLGESGCVSWMFERRGMIYVNAKKYSEDQLLEIALEAGADDMTREDDDFVILTSPENYSEAVENLKNSGVEIQESEVTMKPKNTVKIAGEEAQKLLKLIELLEDNDDVQDVYSNFDIDEAELEKIGAL